MRKTYKIKLYRNKKNKHLNVTIQSMDRLKKLNRAFSRKKKGSNNCKRAKYARAREYKRIADRRRNWFFKLAHQLTDLYSVLVFEDLYLKGMVKLWGRKVTDLAFGEFLQILQYVAMQKGCVVHYLQVSAGPGYLAPHFKSDGTLHLCEDFGKQVGR